MENILIYLLALGKTGIILPKDLPPLYKGSKQIPCDKISNSTSLADHEKNIIINTLQSLEGNRRKTAKELNIGEATLYRKLKKYEITNL